MVLSSMLLDFFATFFSSATALLPIYAQDILHVGAEGYGILSAAPAVGATITALILTFVRRIPHQGKVLVTSVLLFGVSTIVFGLSTTFLVAFLALAATGITDTMSTVIRNTLRQLHTPDYIRGRMVSVNMIFFMGGPQLGELEAGLVAGWVGAPLSVITGGIGCVIAVLWIARQWPVLWQYDQFKPSTPAPAAAD
jgi:MFS family permease